MFFTFWTEGAFAQVSGSYEGASIREREDRMLILKGEQVFRETSQLEATAGTKVKWSASCTSRRGSPGTTRREMK